MDVQEYKNNSLRKLRIATHLLTTTYPLVNDPKLLKVVLKNICAAVDECILMLLHHERQKKNIPPFTNDTEMVMYLLPKIFNRNQINPNWLVFIEELRKISGKQKNAEIEFIRKDRLVFASKNYDLEFLSHMEIKDYLIKAQLFINQTIGVIEDGKPAKC